MSTYLHCDDCGRIFPEDWARTLLSDHGNMILACPDCRCTSLAVAPPCKICGEPIEPGKDYCDECNYKAHKIWEEAVCKIMDIADFDKDYCDCESAFLEYLEDSGVF